MLAPFGQVLPATRCPRKLDAESRSNRREEGVGGARQSRENRVLSATWSTVRQPVRSSVVGETSDQCCFLAAGLWSLVCGRHCLLRVCLQCSARAAATCTAPNRTCAVGLGRDTGLRSHPCHEHAVGQYRDRPSATDLVSPVRAAQDAPLWPLVMQC